MPVQSKVKQYTAEELDLTLISDKCFKLPSYNPPNLDCPKKTHLLSQVLIP